jgi:hypothetical protein
MWATEKVTWGLTFSGFHFLIAEERNGFGMHTPQSPFPFIPARKTLEHLNVTTFLGGSIIGSPVWGFLPLRAYFSCTENFPNPLMRTSSPFCRDCFISSKKGVDDLGRLGFGESVLREECFHDMGFGESH